MKTGRDRILNYVVFALLMVSTALGFQALWGVLFLYWTIPNCYSGHASLLSDVTRDDDPELFWLIQFAWVLFGVLMIASDLMPRLPQG